MVEVDIPQSLFQEQGRQLYGAQLLQLQVRPVFTTQLSLHLWTSMHALI